MIPGMEDTYRTLEGPCEGLWKVKGSKHFGYGFPIETEADVSHLLQTLRKEHHSARHVAYAWRLGHDDIHQRWSDDGEPSNSAGPPIFGVIRAHDLTHVLFAVVRYFGGTKLGVGGLIQAYRDATVEALNQGNIVTRIRTEPCRILFSYEHMGTAMGLIKTWGLEPLHSVFELSCSVEVQVRLSEVTRFIQAVEETRCLEIQLGFTRS
ncbi:MAG: YigZ family protein [Bacteroidetes bacterium]|nr:YigZ family protein [Bacteroidota bacterium]MDA0903057.1 YigZ family protein [Bacteroidota bacterium]MDA1241733.1 YigZ family protein [Bacteroidota bacterium]